EASLDGTWTTTGESEVGYRVIEDFVGGLTNAEAVGRTKDVTGTMTLVGTQVPEGSFEVQMATIESNESRRDGQFRGRIMSVEEFPTADFELTEPIDFATVPPDGEEITATATGELTLRGTTKEVTFDVTARRSGSEIAVNGSIPVLFSDYGIPNPSNPIVSTRDNGTLEFLLVFEPSA
ncbi:MAG TPA: YceI family protein, partial [Microthrixaceae bacterium]|nr:YceI family protein [Microthrixaceae bacterium]